LYIVRKFCSRKKTFAWDACRCLCKSLVVRCRQHELPPRSDGPAVAAGSLRLPRRVRRRPGSGPASVPRGRRRRPAERWLVPAWQRRLRGPRRRRPPVHAQLVAQSLAQPEPAQSLAQFLAQLGRPRQPQPQRGLARRLTQTSSWFISL